MPVKTIPVHDFGLDKYKSVWGRGRGGGRGRCRREWALYSDIYCIPVVLCTNIHFSQVLPVGWSVYATYFYCKSNLCSKLLCGDTQNTDTLGGQRDVWSVRIMYGLQACVYIAQTAQTIHPSDRSF